MKGKGELPVPTRGLYSMSQINNSCLNVCVDGDGMNELVVAYSDRVVRVYRWSSADDSSATLTAVDKWLLAGQVCIVLADALQQASTHKSANPTSALFSVPPDLDV